MSRAVCQSQKSIVLLCINLGGLRRDNETLFGKCFDGSSIIICDLFRLCFRRSEFDDLPTVTVSNGLHAVITHQCSSYLKSMGLH